MISEQEKNSTDSIPSILSIADFVKITAAQSRAQEGVDFALLDILENHILTVSPADDAVRSAVKEIQNLAEARVQPTKENSEVQKNAESDKN